jgi:T-complex protein 1 subunit beta
LIEEIVIGGNISIKLSRCNAGEARGSGSHIIDEAERSMHDVICVLVDAD